MGDDANIWGWIKIAVALALALHEIDQRYLEGTTILARRHNCIKANDTHLFTYVYRTAECGGSSLLYPDNAMHVATRLIHLYLMYPRTFRSSHRLYIPYSHGVSSGS